MATLNTLVALILQSQTAKEGEDKAMRKFSVGDWVLVGNGDGSYTPRLVSRTDDTGTVLLINFGQYTSEYRVDNGKEWIKKYENKLATLQAEKEKI